MSKVIKVPKPGKTAYKPERPLEKNLLIHAQVKNLKEAGAQLPEHHQTGVGINSIKTEGQASHYIRKGTALFTKAAEGLPGEGSRNARYTAFRCRSPKTRARASLDF